MFIATYFASSNGVPVLRHDWGAPNCGFGFVFDALSGWDSIGLGTPIGYPSSFLMWPLRGAVAALLGTYAAHALFFFACDAMIAFGAARLCRNLGGTRAAAIGICSFALFNPWSYVQLVAGHAYVVLGFGALLWVAAEASSETPNALRLMLVALALAPQIQYLVLGAPAYVWLSVRLRDARPVATIAILFLPVLAGIVTTRSSLLATPFTLAWEKSQSLQPIAAATMSGYFAHYDVPIEPIAMRSMLCLLIIALFGAIAGLMTLRRRTLPFVFITSFALAWSVGIYGIAPLFTWSVTNVPEVALFRELYVLVGVVGVGYAALLAIASRAFAPLGYATLVAAFALPVSWSIVPPMSYTVAAASLPKTAIDTRGQTRYLLLPAIGPMSFRGKGSGIDPDLCPSVAGASPIDEYLARYPVSSAIGTYYRDGSLRDLAALGVTRVYDRPWLETDPTIREQLALPMSRTFFDRRTSVTTLAHVPSQLTLSALPNVGSLVNIPGAGNILEGDASEARGAGVPQAWATYEKPSTVPAPNRFVKASEGWVDARLGFLQDPDIAQSFGGALTTNPDAQLPIGAGRFALVFVSGRLTNDRGITLSATTSGYRWVPVSPDTRSLRCNGFCVIAAEKSVARRVPLNPTRVTQRDVMFSRPIPWLVTARVSSANTALLRYNVTYDSLWLAFDAGKMLAHVRIDGAINGWILPPSKAPREITLVEAGALMVTAAEGLSAFGLAALFIGSTRASRRRYRP